MRAEQAKRRSKKVFFLTGAASGIGKHLATRLVAEGHRVFCTDLNFEALQDWVEEEDHQSGPVAIAKLDVRQPLEWTQCIQEARRRFGSIDVVLNIAGYLRPGYAEDVTLAEVDLHLDVNVKGVIFGSQAAAQEMIRQGYGHIINIGSLASLSPVPGLSLYVASKFAVRGYTLSIAEELRSKGIAVTLVLLDAVKTPMLDLQADYEEAAMTFSGSRPLDLEEVSDLFFDQIFPLQPLEVTYPRSRGLLARAAGISPEIARVVGPALRKKGLQAQRKYSPGQEKNS